ncbi:hypothetical protein [Terrisporobacter mayombei]|uniref:Uncharacterized protein n=1 Tax=Terrisporobacter mayombei TaxID=1541 RepID=A0ABY9PZ42_9FIRM|nr:hypothetical protein [Terrisporobacter mayombei]MCC3866755.1 hypothetical protein [Terrisporobacter mayombei]WMT80992.1 hypothetical protein TEMA_13220 [Terrisporobacter mayombei]
MGKSRLDKQDNKIILITVIIGIILEFFMENGMNIAILGGFIFLNHKYAATTKNLKEYSYYKFSDEKAFNKGKKRFALLLDIYSLIRIISLIIMPKYHLMIVELLAITVIVYPPYEKYLEKKYVIDKGIYITKN